MTNPSNNKSNIQTPIRKEDILRLVRYAFLFKKNLFLGILFLLLAVGFGLLSPFIVKQIMDKELVQATVSIGKVLLLAALFMFSDLGGHIAKFTGNYQLQIVSVSVIEKMRDEIFVAMQKQKVAFFDNMPAGKIVSKITNDTAAVGDLYVTVFSQFLTSIVYILGIITALLFIDPLFALLCVGIVFLFVGIVRFYTHYATKHNHIVRDKLSEINALINETIQGISIVQAFGGEKRITDEFEEVNQARVASENKLLILESALSHNIIDALRSFAMMGMVAYFGYFALKDHTNVSVGTIYVYMNYLALLFQQSNGVFDKMPLMQRSIVAAQHVFELMDSPVEEQGKKQSENIRGDVRFENISFAYNEEFVLKDINFEVKAGQTIGLVGHTGSGKSSILNLLMKFYSPQKGRVLIDNQDLQELTAQSVREYMGIVLQEPYLFTGTILSNITLDNPAITREKAEEALRMVGGELVTANLKDGIDEKVVERGSTLSAGQRQLISFARALAHDPRILILDEATSSIDSETEQVVQNAMKVLMQGRTTLVIAHRLSTIRNADKIILLDKGKILEEGNHDQLIEKQGKYYEMYQAQSSGNHSKQ